jgi:hypothetical protein
MQPMSQKPQSTDSAAVVTPGSSKAKYITLAVLVLWVIAVFVMTLLKFAKVW